MSVFTNPIPRGTIPKYHEGSSMRSLRDASAVPQQWKPGNTVATQLAWAVQNIEQLQRQIDRMRKRAGEAEEAGEEVEIITCDELTGEEKVYAVVGREVIEEV